MARPPKAPPPCHCAHEGTVAKPGRGPNGEDRTPTAIHCPRHKRWVPYADPEAPAIIERVCTGE